MFKMYLIIGLAFFSVLAQTNTFTISGELLIKNKGTLLLELIPERCSEAFGNLKTNCENNDSNFKAIIMIGENELKNGKVVFHIENIPSGIYAIQCWQDKNMNGKFDHEPIPGIEPFGNYIENRPFMAHPKFVNSKFVIDKDQSGIIILVK